MTAQGTGRQHPRSSALVHRHPFSCDSLLPVPVLLAVVAFLGALTLALAGAVVAVVLAAFAIGLLTIALLAVSLLAAFALADCPHPSVVVLHVRPRRSACRSADK